MDTLEIIRENLLKKENNLSKFACKSNDAVRLLDKIEDIRPAYFHDTDTIIHSSSYARYMDKTQVYSFKGHDHISKRMLHVQMVSKIARTIGRCLNLNEDLIEAISLGHDIGHTPLGHTGERFLNEISMKELGIPFMHNLQSVRAYMTLSNNGKGSNLTVQVLDGMMCHNGEMLENVYKPKKKTVSDFLSDYENSCKSDKFASQIRPMTLEGCVVRISDVIAYIGRDIEDAIVLGNLKRDEIPSEIVKILGNNNREIINTIVLDVVKNSYGKNEIALSKDVFDALNNLKDFNYENIYNNANTNSDLAYYKEGMNKLYYSLLDDLNDNKENSKIYKMFLSNMDKSYVDKTDNRKIVIDFIAGMTDGYFITQLNNLC